ncbi:class II fructose-bisphosphate aldolase [Buchnera aphidicola]|uniref:class II fructose-bisphosphate aldolase n=1 Tax=Buchnera aphidicola TaxID=9 RepID=UPI0031B837DB
MSTILDIIKPGIIFGEDIKKLFNIAKEKKFAIPAINCTSIDTINAVLETADRVRSPVIIQFSYTGCIYMAGKNIKNTPNHIKATLGAISAAHHVHLVAKKYNIPVILHTDHCHRNILPWIDNLLHIGKKHFKKTGYPIFSSHMLDLSSDPIKENILICSTYLSKMKKINMILEIELGCTGGEEDGINNENINNELLYTNPIDINYAYEKLSEISKNFTIAAAFGNVHGVYNTQNIHLKPEILKNAQKYIVQQHHLNKLCPINFVFHGGSGSSIQDIKKSINYGVVKINFDTDIQWYSWRGILEYYKSHKLYLQTQLGNPSGQNEPNKKHYDPRKWMHASKKSISKRMKKIFKKLNAYHLW